MREPRLVPAQGFGFAFQFRHAALIPKPSCQRHPRIGVAAGLEALECLIQFLNACHQKASGKIAESAIDTATQHRPIRPTGRNAPEVARRCTGKARGFQLTQVGPRRLSRAHFQRFSPQGTAAHERFIPRTDPLMANAIRALSMDAVQKANSGHPGLPMGAADVATVLFTQFLKFDAADPHWPDRDRFILSAGHGSMLMYSAAPSPGLQRHDAGRDSGTSASSVPGRRATRSSARHRNRDDHGTSWPGHRQGRGFRHRGTPPSTRSSATGSFNHQDLCAGWPTAA